MRSIGRAHGDSYSAGMHAVTAAAIAVACAACSSPPAGTLDAGPSGEGIVQVSGTFGGASLSGIDHALSEVTTSSKGTSLEIVLAEVATCGDVTAGPSENAEFLVLSLYSIDSGTDMSLAPKTPGTFSLDVTSAGPFAEADVVTFDATCAPQTASTGQFASGTVTVSAISDDTARGTFTLSSGGSDTATGSFTTALCPGAGELAFPGSTSSCHP